MMTGRTSFLSGAIMRLAGHVIVVGLVVSSGYLVGASPQGGLRVLDVCSEAHKFRCEDGELISLVDITCGRQGSCSRDINQTVFDLCQGQQTCTTLGIEVMLSPDCSIKDNSIRVTFQCGPGSSSLCIANICDDVSAGLSCPERSLVHLRKVSCYSVTGACSRSVYTSLFLCEGVSRCAASGLKTLLSQNCQHESREKRNVIIFYSCVPDQLIENRCSSSKYRVLDKDFGIIRYPYLESSTRMASSECRWIINPIPGFKVKVTVHIVNTKIRPTGCDPGVLSVTYDDCDSGSTITRSFCIVDNSSVDLLSCGQVKIVSLVLPGLESSDKFIVSYSRYHSTVANPEPSGLASCVAPVIILPTETPPPQPAFTQPFLKTEVRQSSQTQPSTTQNYGFGDGMVEYRNSLSSEGANGAGMSRQAKPSSKQLKIIILYIFFGVVILVLSVALIAVLISYYRISKLRDHRGDSSEKTALCQHHEGTPLDTFHNHFAESCGPSETTYAFRTDNNSDQVLATVHHDGTSEQEEVDNRYSSGSRISTFLSGKRDSDFRDLINTFQTGSFALYTSLGDSSSSGQIDAGEPSYFEMADTGHYDIPSNHELSDIYEAIDHDKVRGKGDYVNQGNSFNSDVFTVRNHDHENGTGANYTQQPLAEPRYSPSNDLHYRVNDDEYAIVCKQKKQLKTMVCDEDQEDGLNNGVSVDFCPTSGPYDRRRQFAADTGARWSKGDNDRWGDEL